MPPTSPPDDPRDARMTPERLEALLEAYGAAAERWPEAERDAARQAIEASADARRLWQQAAHLDRLLDALRADAPSSALALRVLAAAPRPPVQRVWRRVLVAAVPLSAAAAVILWLATGHEPVRPAPVVPLGEYTSPTDVLLEPYGIDVSDTVPSIGCADSVLGCPAVDSAAKPYSQRQSLGRVHA
jgi:hypothetical protein